MKITLRFFVIYISTDKKTMYLDKFQIFLKYFLKNIDVFFQELHDDEEMYISIINSLNKKIDFLKNLLTVKETEHIEVKNIYEEKMLYLVHINNVLLESSLNLRKRIEHIENESIFTKFKKSFLKICTNQFDE